MLDMTQLSEGQKVMLSYKKIIYQAVIKKVYDKFFLAQISDIPQENIFSLQNGEFVAFSVGVNNEILCCNSKIIGIKKEENNMILVFNNPQIQKTIEKRVHVRIPLKQDIYYIKMPVNLEYTPFDDLPKRFKTQSSMSLTTSVDISSGGISIFTSHDYKIGDILMLNIKLDEEYYVRGKVVRSQHIRRLQYLTAFQFVQLDEGVFEKLSNYIVSKLEQQPPELIQANC